MANYLKNVGFKRTDFKNGWQDSFCARHGIATLREKEDKYIRTFGERPLTKAKWIVNKPVEAESLGDLEKKFNELAKRWRKETGGYSTTIHRTRNDNYLDIIGMGDRAVRFILSDLKKEADYWFEALRHITKANPVPKEHLGDIEKMRIDWINWGEKNNLI